MCVMRNCVVLVIVGGYSCEEPRAHPCLWRVFTLGQTVLWSVLIRAVGTLCTGNC